MRAKIFRTEGHIQAEYLEDDVNKWLKENPDVETRDRQLHTAGESITIVIWYTPP
ncbi:hypothetical protein IH979_00625 [Patescibacteria group bacterium]|nr:hypothetical protein [Patescibacteria group bacterium]